MATRSSTVLSGSDDAVAGAFVDFHGERYYAIQNVDEMPEFFVSLVSHSDHWLFASSNGGLTAGRVSPDTALFPYVTVDKIHDSVGYTGPVTLIRIPGENGPLIWEPLGPHPDRAMDTTRTIYKNTLGNRLCFEEHNATVQLTFRYHWAFSDEHGFVRHCELVNHAKAAVRLDILDGLLNILPAGAPRFAQTNTSNLVDAYKWTELDSASGLAYYTLYSGITDRAEPCESLRANTAYALGLDGAEILLCEDQVELFRRGLPLKTQQKTRGQRGAYLATTELHVAADSSHEWFIVADIEQDQPAVVSLLNSLGDHDALVIDIRRSIDNGSSALAGLMASSDAFQETAEEAVGVHHYANVLFNVLRGGVFNDNYKIYRKDLKKTIQCFDQRLAEQHSAWLDTLPQHFSLVALKEAAETLDDPQITRLCHEYLPIRFGRRHGDPSRPWNQFAIELKDDSGAPLLAYQGNWRDVFQNWEALAFSYPGFVENMIAKFVNASTIDGYNPYRITSEGIDWEVEEPDDPWSYIGYWGDHQIIYLQKLLELSSRFHPEELSRLLHQPIFCYANVPYRIRGFDELLADPKNTVTFDKALAETIEHRISERGADGKLVMSADDQVYLVTLTEKLLVPLLSKLSNLVIDGGIWLNTQRPEWNDANNALVGNGLSMVTLYYLRRYVTFLQSLFVALEDEIELSREVAEWLSTTATSLREAAAALSTNKVDQQLRFDLLEKLGRAAEVYRNSVYPNSTFSGKSKINRQSVDALLSNALVAVDRCISVNKRPDGMYHAYNILSHDEGSVDVEHLYPMLEGQVAALSAGSVTPEGAVEVLEALFNSGIYKNAENSFMLYPDRDLPSFLNRNIIPASAIDGIDLIEQMLAAGDYRLVVRDANGNYRFSADLTNRSALIERLTSLQPVYGDAAFSARKALLACYEQVFNHKAFTGRSGTMFGFEGLGCIYWHMVSKLLLAVQENYFSAREKDASADTCRQLGKLYYRVRGGIGFNKTPEQYGAFPTDPYSHTHGNGGARQPGMTGQVKEEILTRFGELGVQVANGAIRFEPSLLLTSEFNPKSREFRYLDVFGKWQSISLPRMSLAFTWCQVPIVYTLSSADRPSITVEMNGGDKLEVDTPNLDATISSEIFNRTGQVNQISVSIDADLLFE